IGVDGEVNWSQDGATKLVASMGPSIGVDGCPIAREQLTISLARPMRSIDLCRVPVRRFMNNANQCRFGDPREHIRTRQECSTARQGRRHATYVDKRTPPTGRRAIVHAV